MLTTTKHAEQIQNHIGARQAPATQFNLIFGRGYRCPFPKRGETGQRVLPRRHVEMEEKSVCTVWAMLDDSGMQGFQALHEVDVYIRGAAFLRPRIRGAVVSLPEGTTDPVLRSPFSVSTYILIYRTDLPRLACPSPVHFLHAAADDMTYAIGWRGDEAERATGPVPEYGVIDSWDCTLHNCRA